MTTPPWGGEEPQQQPYPPPPPGQVPPYQPYGQAGYGAQPPYGGGYPTAPQNQTNGMAIASMVLSIVGAIGLCAYGAGGILALLGAILGHVAIGQIKRTGQGGHGLALAGVIVGWIAVALMVVVVFVVVAGVLGLSLLGAAES